MKTLLLNGKVWLNDNSFAKYVGIDSDTGKIIETGIDGCDIRAYDEIIDLKEKVVLPAFQDGHMHFVYGAIIKSQLDLRYVRTIEEIREKISDYRKINHGKKWIAGGYFSEANFKENFVIGKKLLDELIPDLPACIFRNDLHSCYLNSNALGIIGIENLINKFGREVVTDSSGKPTGELTERAMIYMTEKVSPLSLTDLSDIVKMQIKRLHSLGITAVSDITRSEDVNVYKYLIENNELNLRLDTHLPFEKYKDTLILAKEYREYRDLIRFRAVKAYYDGSLSSSTALFYEPYKGLNHSGYRSDFAESGEFKKYGYEIDKAGLQIIVHAIGDRAVSELLDFAEELIRINGIRERRFRIEHAQHIDEKDIERFKKLDVVVSVQPGHLWFDADLASEKIINYSSAHVYKKLIDRGVTVNFGSDFPVTEENPFETIYYAVTRKTKKFPDGFYIENSIPLNYCLKAYTLNNAYACFSESERGLIKTGYFADLIVTDRDIFESDPDDVKNTEIVYTFFNGKMVYESV